MSFEMVPRDSTKCSWERYCAATSWPCFHLNPVQYTNNKGEIQFKQVRPNDGRSVSVIGSS